MLKKVTIARALKEKNRIAGRLAQSRNLVSSENSHEKRVPRRVDVRAALGEAEELKRRLVAVKTAIAKANQGIVAKIIELEETKSEIAWFNSINTKEGVFEETDYRNQTKTQEFEVVIKQAETLEKVKELQKKADALQDDLDTFNGSTIVEIELED